jgi:hypothetical protein
MAFRRAMEEQYLELRPPHVAKAEKLSSTDASASAGTLSGAER